MTTPLRGIHHSAYRCRDAEETRAFYEAVLGLPPEAVVQEEKEARASDLEQAVVVKNFITTSPLRHRQSENMTRPTIPNSPQQLTTAKMRFVC